jgi:uncharacterized protein with HEPN domain
VTHPERVEDYLEHIVQAIDRAIRYTQPLKDAAALRENEKTQDAVVRTIEIIGEAAGRIQKVAPAFVAANTKLPWIEMRGMRNKMIHEYFDVDWDVVWRTVKVDLPVLRGLIIGLLAAGRAEEAGKGKTEGR